MVDGANRTYKTYYIKTFGCQANKSDSERIEGDYQAEDINRPKIGVGADEIIVDHLRGPSGQAPGGDLFTMWFNILKHQKNPSPRLS